MDGEDYNLQVEVRKTQSCVHSVLAGNTCMRNISLAFPLHNHEYIASFPGPGYKIKCGSGLGMRLYIHLTGMPSKSYPLCWYNY